MEFKRTGEFIVEQDETKDDINSLFVDEDRLISTHIGWNYLCQRSEEEQNNGP